MTVLAKSKKMLRYLKRLPGNARKNNFSQDLEEDVKVRKYIAHRLPNAGISKVEIARSSKKVTVTIFTARPGIVIGRGGEEVNRLKKELRQLTGKKDAQINISEVKRPELDAALVGANIAHQLKKKISQVPALMMS